MNTTELKNALNLSRSSRDLQIGGESLGFHPLCSGKIAIIRVFERTGPPWWRQEEVFESRTFADERKEELSEQTTDVQSDLTSWADTGVELDYSEQEWNAMIFESLQKRPWSVFNKPVEETKEEPYRLGEAQEVRQDEAEKPVQQTDPAPPQWETT